MAEIGDGKGVEFIAVGIGVLRAHQIDDGMVARHHLCNGVAAKRAADHPHLAV